MSKWVNQMDAYKIKILTWHGLSQWIYNFILEKIFFEIIWYNINLHYKYIKIDEYWYIQANSL